MNLNKHIEFFNPDTINHPIHIIGCGAIGSTIAEQLARIGVKSLHLYDFDTVNSHNITNQMYLNSQIGHKKINALTALLKAINPDIEIIQHPKGWQTGMPLNGYIFLAVDNIEIRQKIIADNVYNKFIIAMYDTRMRLTDAQHYSAFWNNEGIAFLQSTMNFTHEEAQAATPISACGTTLCITPTVRIICALAVSNFINTINNKKITKTILIDAFKMYLDAFDENGLIQ